MKCESCTLKTFRVRTFRVRTKLMIFYWILPKIDLDIRPWSLKIYKHVSLMILYLKDVHYLLELSRRTDGIRDSYRAPTLSNRALNSWKLQKISKSDLIKHGCYGNHFKNIDSLTSQIDLIDWESSLKMKFIQRYNSVHL